MVGRKNKQKIKTVKKEINKIKSVVGRIKRGPHVKGRGGYVTDAINFGKKVWNNLNEDQRPDASPFNKAANSLGQAIGGQWGIGKQLGNAGSWLSRVFGMGKYHVNKNTLAYHPNGERICSGDFSCNMPPSFGSDKRGSDIIFSHREFVKDINSRTSFGVEVMPINPGNPNMFPWMSQIASLYEEYEFLGLIFEYKSSCGTGMTGTVPAVGNVIMATDYDCYDFSYTNKRTMEAAEFASSGVPYDNFYHAVECDPERNVLKRGFVVPGMTVYTDASGDARFSVLGNFAIATQAQQAADIPMGELWVSYHVRLSRPILEVLASGVSMFTQRTDLVTAVNGALPGTTQFANYISSGTGVTLSPVNGTYGATTLRTRLSSADSGLSGNIKFDFYYVADTTPTYNTLTNYNAVNLSACSVLDTLYDGGGPVAHMTGCASTTTVYGQHPAAQHSVVMSCSSGWSFDMPIITANVNLAVTCIITKLPITYNKLSTPRFTKDEVPSYVEDGEIVETINSSSSSSNIDTVKYNRSNKFQNIGSSSIFSTYASSNRDCK